MKKRKKKRWTTKNTHLKRMKRRNINSLHSMSGFEKKCYQFCILLFILYAILVIFLKAFNNQAVGYDYFPSIPPEWIEWLK